MFLVPSAFSVADSDCREGSYSARSIVCVSSESFDQGETKNDMFVLKLHLFILIVFFFVVRVQFSRYDHAAKWHRKVDKLLFFTQTRKRFYGKNTRVIFSTILSVSSHEYFNETTADTLYFVV